MNVGIRELKAHLSQYLSKVREGEQIIVTDRGEPIARIEPVSVSHLPAKMQEMIRSGRMIHRGPLRYFPPRVKMTPGDRTSTDYVSEQRR